TRCVVWPCADWPGMALVTTRVLWAVPAEQARQLYAVRRKMQRAAQAVGWPRAREAAGLSEAEEQVHHAGEYGVRNSPVTLARAVAHLCRYPAELLTAPADAVAAVLNGLGRRALS